jgi:hypothetical protein
MRFQQVVLGCFLLTSGSVYAQRAKVKVKKTFEYTFGIDQNDNQTPKGTKRFEEYQKYNEQGQETELGRYGQYTCTTTRHGNQITIESQVDDSKLHSIEYYSYDSLGRKTKERLWYFREGKRSYSPNCTIFNYDENNRIGSEITKNDSCIEKITTYKYDEWGNNIEQRDSVLSGSREGVSIQVKKFGKHNKILELKHYIQGNRLLLRKKFVYADDFRRVTQFRYGNEVEL